MNFPDWPQRDEFGELIRASLQNRLKEQTPSRRVWRRIRRRLREPRSRSRPWFTLRSSLVAQIALLLLVLTVGGAGSLFRADLRLTPTRTADAVTAIAYYRLPSTDDMPADIPSFRRPRAPVRLQEAYLFDAQQRRRLRTGEKPSHAPPPIVLPPTDVMSHRYDREAPFAGRVASYPPELFLAFGSQKTAGVIQ